MLVQQGTQKIEVIVKKETEGGGNGIPKEKSPDEQQDKGVYSKWFGTSSEKRKKRIIITNTTHALSTAINITNHFINWKVGRLGMERGDQAYQEMVQRQVEIVQDRTSLASSVAMGAVYGAWGGPVGAVVGAALGAANTGASLFFKYKNRADQYDFKVFKENLSIEYQRARAGINLTTGRLR